MIDSNQIVAAELSLPEQPWADHLAALAATGEMAPATRTAYLKAFQHFTRWYVGHDHSGQRPRQVVMAWLAELNAHYATATVALWLAGLRAYFRWLVDEGVIEKNPAADVRGPRRRNGKKHKRLPLTRFEANRVLDAPDRTTDVGKRDYFILALMLFTAVRTIEVHRADLGDLRAEQNRLVLYVQGKGRDEKDELVVLANKKVQDAAYGWLAVRGHADKTEPLFTSLSNRSAGDRLSLRAIRWLVKTHFASVGVVDPNKTTHSLRHTAITNAIENNAAPRKVQRMARHTSFDTTMIYLHELDRITSPAEDAIDYGE